MPANGLRKYRDAMRKMGVEKIDVVRASAESLPFRNMAFDLVLSLSMFSNILRNPEKPPKKFTG